MVPEHLAFPALPAQAFQGAPVYLEPMMGSGEWLTVLVAVVGSTETTVIPAIRPAAVRVMYGAKAENFKGLVKLLQESLHDHLIKWRSFEGWHPPLASARLGDVKSLLSDDANGALRQLVLLHASLSAVDENEDECENDTIDDQASAYWWKDVKSAVVACIPTLASRFDVRIDGRVAGYQFRLGFLDHGLAVHFGLARPDRLSQDGRDLKAKLWELQAVRTSRIDIDEAGLVLCTPPPSPLFGAKKLASAQALIHEIQAEAEDGRLKLYPVTTTEEAADLFIRRIRLAA